MDNLNINSKILYTNAKNFGIDLVAMYQDSAIKISNLLLNKFGKDKTYSIICGLGGNGGDGFAIAKELSKTSKVILYLIGRNNHIEDQVSFELWKDLKEVISDKLTIKQDAYAEDIVSTDVILDCLVGTGIIGEKLNKRFGDIIKRISHFKKERVAIDIGSIGYKPDFTISLIYPKTQDAEVIEVFLPKELLMYPGPGEVEVLFKPKKHSYKVKNGKLLYIFNTDNPKDLEKLTQYSQDYLVNLITYSPKNTHESISDHELSDSIDSCDTLFLGDFENSLVNRALINEVLKFKDKKFILSKSVLDLINIEILKNLKEKIFILDKNNISKFNIGDKSDKGYKRIALEYKTNLIVPSVQSYIYSANGEFRLDLSGTLFNNAAQEDLLCLVATLSTKNDMWLSLRAADFMLVKL